MIKKRIKITTISIMIFILIIGIYFLKEKQEIEILDTNRIETESGYIKIIKDKKMEERDTSIKYNGKFYKGSMLDFSNAE